MRTFLFPLLCLLTINLNGQITKGVTPVAETSGDASGGTTRAVVVGISDYQDPGIPDLNYAHRDAEAFAEYLQSAAGGSLGNDQFMLLLNENATRGKLLMAFDWLIEESTEGDQAIIYFSGHGDVETKTKIQEGYLLTYDSPPKVYIGGAIKVHDLQIIISSLSEKDVQLMVVTDACHSGNLAGKDYRGSQATTAALAQQFTREVKILSCQPDEYSLEGEQWGGGRGAFSYHFINGLYGLADKNQDLAVNLIEIRRYLEDIVPAETDPHIQYPMTVGSNTARIAVVNSEILAALKAKYDKAEPQFTTAESKGIEEDVLAAADSSIQEQYEAFKTALTNGNLMSPAGTSANDLYILLSNEPSMAPLHSFMRRNLTAALMDESQQVVNNVLKNDPEELARIFGRGLYRHIPGYLERAAELLGTGHYFHDRVKGAQHLFEAYNLLTNTPYEELVVLQNREAIPLAKKALELAGEGAFIYDFLGALYVPIHADSAAHYFKKAMRLSPTYASPYNNMGVVYSWVRNPFLKIGNYKKAIKTDPRYFPAYDNIGGVFGRKRWYKKAESWYNKSVEVFPNALAYSNLGLIYYKQGRYAEAKAMCLKGIEAQATYFKSYCVLADVYKATGEDARLSALLVDLEALAEARHGDYSEVALGYLYLKDYDNFRSNYYKANARYEPLAPAFFCEVGSLYAAQGKKDEALQWLELAFSRGFSDRKSLRKDENFKSLRKDNRYRKLKRKYRKNFNATCKDCLWSGLRKEKI
ncbi:MAG: tetratricopeptide repeat protein [Bacteroidetes bacterium]|nr:MAG: tetratricopeptide repeat protein [Bacteroidota bacterium]